MNQIEIPKQMAVNIEGCGLAGIFVGWELWKRGIPFLHHGNRLAGASRVAAGLMNPVTGKGMNVSWRLSEFLPEAREFFQKVEAELGEKYFHETPVLRIFATEKERGKFDSRRDELEPLIAEEHKELPEIKGSEFGGVTWRGGGWVDVPAFLRDSLAFFESHAQPPSQAEESIRVWCQGALGLVEGPFASLPTRLAKGEILEFEAPGWKEERILNRRGWLIPIGDGRFRVGATYEWEDLSDQPTEKGLNWLKSLAREFTDCEILVRNHVAGIRPIVRNSIPVVGEHPERMGDYILNGLGSKGCLYGPSAARQLVGAIFADDVIDPDFTLASVKKAV